jgi:hypothetical protein
LAPDARLCAGLLGPWLLLRLLPGSLARGATPLASVTRLCAWLLGAWLLHLLRGSLARGATLLAPVALLHAARRLLAWLALGAAIRAIALLCAGLLRARLPLRILAGGASGLGARLLRLTGGGAALLRARAHALAERQAGSSKQRDGCHSRHERFLH